MNSQPDYTHPDMPARSAPLSCPASTLSTPYPTQPTTQVQTHFLTARGRFASSTSSSFAPSTILMLSRCHPVQQKIFMRQQQQKFEQQQQRIEQQQQTIEQQQQTIVQQQQTIVQLQQDNEFLQRLFRIMQEQQERALHAQTIGAFQPPEPWPAWGPEAHQIADRPVSPEPLQVSPSSVRTIILNVFNCTPFDAPSSILSLTADRFLVSFTLF